ncbi:MAG TPA: acyl carrier protein [Thermoguttaceae bacterium]|nr:acyl carrier protein [Thermoguttaceae bacterium]
MKDDIREYLMEHRASEDACEFGDEDSLLELSVIDSLVMVDLIAHLEKAYHITIDEDDMVPENFDSVAAIVAYVRRKQAESGASVDCQASSE